MMTQTDETLPRVQATEYIAAIAHHVSSVCVITTEWQGLRFGLTATAVSSVSADPPRLLVCVNKSGTTHEKILAARHFAVNVLSEDQDDVAKAFAGMGGVKKDRFETGQWVTAVTGSPLLVGASTSFDCVLSEISDQSTHSVFFGDVVATSRKVGDDPLLYGARRFRQLKKAFAGLNDGTMEYL
jgi:flavin reductase (DIM6/NTAB) family NADH-FMN oxidoreductase RutF